MRYIALAVLALASLGACNDKPPKQTKEQRAAEIKEKLAVLPAAREYTVNGHQLIVLSVPIDQFGFIEYQRCFVWRDQEFKSASMQCQQPPELEPPEP
jgi:hypothetical protein